MIEDNPPKYSKQFCRDLCKGSGFQYVGWDGEFGFHEWQAEFSTKKRQIDENTWTVPTVSYRHFSLTEKQIEDKWFGVVAKGIIRRTERNNLEPSGLTRLDLMGALA